ncbi:MAG: DUF883 family protein [Caulobacter sp.]|nr:DUF883 family protein [Caulobacter sp.]
MSDYADSLNPNPAANGASRARAKVEPKLKAAASSAQDAYDSLREVATDAANETTTRVKDFAAQAGGQIQRRYDDLEAWVQLKPAQAVGVAAGVGLLLGLLLRGGSTKTIYLRDAG